MPFQPLYFPPGVVDADGRRVRPGVVVSVDGRSGTHEVIGWRVEGLVLLDLETDDIFAAPKETCRVADADQPRMTAGTYVVETSDRRTTLVAGVGTRDIAVDGAFFETSSTRSSSKEVLDSLHTMEMNEALEWCRAHLTAPILDRVLREASLPVELDEIVLIVTDQRVSHPQDTLFVGELVRWHLLSRGHTGDEVPLDDDIRPISRVSVVTLDSLPHVTESVFFTLSPVVPAWFESSGRVAVATSGGTPAMSFGALLAAASFARHADLPSNSVRTIQVPDRRGDETLQPVIEFDVDDLNWWNATR